MKIAIYSRKSLFTGKGESVENQIEMCRNYIKMSLPDIKSNEIFIYEDEGFSAKDLNRPQFLKMMDDLDIVEFDYIICYRLDRLSRNVSDFSSLIELLDKKGINLICIKEHFDTSSPMGRAMMYITSVFAQLERETLAERVRDNMHMLARTGRWLGGTAPTGYQSTEVSEIIIDGKIKTSHILEFNSNEIETVKTIFNKFSETHSVSAVSKHLIENNVMSRNGRYFSNLGIRNILQNPVYCIADNDAYDYFRSHGTDLFSDKEKWNGKHGISAYNKRNYSKSGAPRNKLSVWIIAVGKHQGIISGKDWVNIQNYFHTDSSEKIVNRSDFGLLSGWIFCTKCGEKMFAKKQNSASENYSYICSSKLKGGTKLCSCKNLLGAQTDRLIIDYIKNELESDEIYNNFKSAKRQYLNTDIYCETNKLKKEIQKTQKEIDLLTHRLTENDLSNISIKAIDNKINEKHSLICELQNKLNFMNNSEKTTTNVDTVLTTLRSFKNCFDNLSVFDKRQIVRLLIQKIEWDGENLNIYIYNKML